MDEEKEAMMNAFRASHGDCPPLQSSQALEREQWFTFLGLYTMAWSDARNYFTKPVDAAQPAPVPATEAEPVYRVYEVGEKVQAFSAGVWVDGHICCSRPSVRVYDVDLDSDGSHLGSFGPRELRPAPAPAPKPLAFGDKVHCVEDVDGTRWNSVGVVITATEEFYYVAFQGFDKAFAFCIGEVKPI